MALKKLQVSWAQTLLGFRAERAGQWALVVAECGWVRRLGTRMLEKAVLLKARVALLPETLPASRLLHLASSSSSPSWATAVKDIQINTFPELPIPDITSFLSLEEVREARSSRTAR